MPESVKALGRVQEILDRMVEVATNHQMAPTQLEEGMQQIYQGVVEIRRLIASFEEFAETLDRVSNVATQMQGTLTPHPCRYSSGTAGPDDGSDRDRCFRLGEHCECAVPPAEPADPRVGP
eukprot:5480122-Pyramimonas_sp.AAC.1